MSTPEIIELTSVESDGALFILNQLHFLPSHTHNSLVRDLDAYRLIFLSRFHPESQHAIPEYLLNTFISPSKSYKMVYYSSMVVLMIFGWSIPSIAYSAYGPVCVPGENLNQTLPAVDHCVWQNYIPPTELNNLGSICANIFGLVVYNHINGKYEKLRNRVQDSLHEIEMIYMNIAKFTLRKFSQNFKIVHEFCEEMEYNFSEVIIKTQNSLSEETWNFNIDILDRYLLKAGELNILPIPVRFKEIILTLNQLENIRTNLIKEKIPEKIVDKILEPLVQIRTLLLGENNSENVARKAIYNLIFVGTDKPVLLSSAIFEVITNESMAEIIQTYLINNTHNIRQPYYHSKDKIM